MNNIGLWLDEPQSELPVRAAQKLGVGVGDLKGVRVVRQVLDARKKNSPRYIYTLEVELAEGRMPASLPPDVSVTEAPPPPPEPVKRQPKRPPIIIGTGPAGLFCALGLRLALDRKL